MIVSLAEVELPDFGSPTVEPSIPREIYAARLKSAARRAHVEGYDLLVVYADREHSANLAYLTGFDPRFEEALLILTVGGRATLMVGNECWGYAEVSPLDSIHKVKFQSFSLLAQNRDESPKLAELLRAAGVGPGKRVGVVGWKYFTSQETDQPDQWIEIPSYLAESLRSLAGQRDFVTNANHLFMNPGDGLRVLNDVHQLAAFEYAACHTSSAVKNVLFGLEPGMTEYQAVTLMKVQGMPLSCHLMLSSGERATMGLPSPSSRPIARGDRFTTAYGVWGALNCRAGFVVENETELPDDIRDYVPRLVEPYFRAIVKWYETIGLNVRGNALYEIVMEELGDPFFGLFLNPGHQIHLDEWVSSPIYEGSRIELRSGMAFQVDVIPATGTKYFTTNIEDGIALADDDLRHELAERYPEAWRRIEARRAFMNKGLGIRLKPEVLPFSNIPAYLPPFLLSPRNVMTAVH